MTNWHQYQGGFSSAFIVNYYMKILTWELVILQVIAANSVDVMCNCYGSHVLRTLLCLCKGVPLDKSGFYLSKSTTALAQRMNSKDFSSKNDCATNFQSGFPDLLNLLVSEMLKHASKCIKSLQVDQFSSLVFQACLTFVDICIVVYHQACYGPFCY